MKAVLFVAIAISASAQAPKYDAKHLPRFEDFPVSEKWSPPATPVKLTTASEKMFRTKLANGSKEPPNFAGHFRFVMWGCGSNCGAGAVIDLSTGLVHRPPLLNERQRSGWLEWLISAAFFEGPGVDFRLDSRLVIVNTGMDWDDKLNRRIEDTYYFVWEADHFRRLLFVAGKQPQKRKPDASLTIAHP